MKVFISCSNSLSREYARVLRNWIKYTLTSADPIIAPSDSDKGKFWFADNNEHLIDTKIGIVCVDKANKDNPWVLFEAGSLVSRLPKNKVFTFLIDLTAAELDSPLALVEHIQPNKEDMKKLLNAINLELENKALEKMALDQVFDTYWPWFEEMFKNTVATSSSDQYGEVVKTTENNTLAEILYTPQSLGKRIQYMKLKNRTLHADRNFSRMELIDRVSKMKLIDRIAFLMNKGLQPDEIAAELEGIAPIEYIMDVSSFMYENSNIESH